MTIITCVFLWFFLLEGARMMLKSVEKLRKKLEEDTAGDFVFTTYPEQHGFRAGATIENYEAIADEIEQEVSERYMELPLDADGVPIRVGDVLTDGEYKFKVFELAAFGDGSWSIRNEDGNAWAACDVTHHHEPTVEDVLREMHLEIDRRCERGSIDYDELFAKYAAKLQLREDASRGVCTPVTKGNMTTCSVCGSGGIVKERTELRGWGGELVHMHAELWPYCPQCGAKLMEVE